MSISYMRQIIKKNVILNDNTYMNDIFRPNSLIFTKVLKLKEQDK